jgi:hypothetical protein
VIKQQIHVANNTVLVDYCNGEAVIKQQIHVANNT